MRHILILGLFLQQSYCATLFIPIDALIMPQIEQMAFYSQMPTSKMPYSVNLIRQYNAKITQEHPDLYSTINNYLNSLDSNKTLTKERIYIEAGLNKSTINIPNNHGINSSSNYQAQGIFFGNFHNNIKGSFEAKIYDNNEPKIATNNSYISIGIDAFQMDVGYKDHYYGHFKNGALQISTNARNSPSVTISNGTPFQLADINYEVFLSKLNQTNGIHYNTKLYEGKPNLLGMHLDFHPISHFEVSLDRTFQFGGGPRAAGLSEIYHAVADPFNSDNSNSTCNTDCETGNQQAAISVNYNFKNFALYGTYAGEDTNGGNQKLGNVTRGFGVFIPKLFNQISTRYEFLDIGTAWYVHHLYDNGYSNYGNSMGNWFGDTLKKNDSPGGYLHYLEIINDFFGNSLNTSFRIFQPNTSQTNQNYTTYKSLQFTVFRKQTKVNTKFNFLMGNNLTNEKFSYLTFGVYF